MLRLCFHSRPHQILRRPAGNPHPLLALEPSAADMRRLRLEPLQFFAYQIARDLLVLGAQPLLLRNPAQRGVNVAAQGLNGARSGLNRTTASVPVPSARDRAISRRRRAALPCPRAVFEQSQQRPRHNADDGLRIKLRCVPPKRFSGAVTAGELFSFRFRRSSRDHPRTDMRQSDRRAISTAAVGIFKNGTMKSKAAFNTAST